jgi:transposase
MPKPTKLDPSRLTHIAAVRDRHKTTARALYADADTLRDRRHDARRRLATARVNAEGFTAHPEHSDAQIEKLAAELAEIDAQIAELTAHAQTEGEAGADAGRLLARCLEHATAEGLTIPPRLAAEAAGRNFAPQGVQE